MVDTLTLTNKEWPVVPYNDVSIGVGVTMMYAHGLDHGGYRRCNGRPNMTLEIMNMSYDRHANASISAYRSRHLTTYDNLVDYPRTAVTYRINANAVQCPIISNLHSQLITISNRSRHTPPTQALSIRQNMSTRAKRRSTYHKSTPEASAGQKLFSDRSMRLLQGLVLLRAVASSESSNYRATQQARR